MNRLKLILFALNHASARAVDRAGADWCGGDTRGPRSQAHDELASQALHALLPKRRR
ncbi:hypothetical protein V8J82_18130 [Gymnodinialimonas sp. 2305UL16-5]|uniref:hypothetical protein n=1 Tax=Gymnodinialimonas mytili TaxID=3126503 RepID=UPI003096D9FF